MGRLPAQPESVIEEFSNQARLGGALRCRGRMLPFTPQTVVVSGRSRASKEVEGLTDMFNAGP